MLSPTEKVRRLASGPVASLMAGWQVKLPVAAFGGSLWQHVLFAGDLYATAVGRHPELMLITATVVVLDMVAGLGRAWRNGHSITSGRLRATGWKVIEYALVVLVGLLVSDAIMHSSVPDAAAIWGETAMIYICITEGKSCIENAVGEKAAGEILDDVPGIGKGEPEPASQDDQVQ